MPNRDSSLLPLVFGIVGVLLGGVIGLMGTKWTLDASADQARIDRRVEAYADFSSIMTNRFTNITTEAFNGIDGAPPAQSDVTEVDRQALLEDVTAVTDAYFRVELVGSSDVSRAAKDAFSAYMTASTLAQDKESTGEELGAAVGTFGDRLAEYLAIASLELS